jgi:hypothetical protein
MGGGQMSGFHDTVYSDAYSPDGAKKVRARWRFFFNGRGAERARQILDLNVVQAYADKVAAVGAHWQRLVEEHFGTREYPPAPRRVCACLMHFAFSAGEDPVLTMRDNLWPL